MTGKQYPIVDGLAGNYAEGLERRVAKNSLAKRKSAKNRRTEQNNPGDHDDISGNIFTLEEPQLKKRIC
ncbi:MAG: hypothetical protein MZU79_05700 [Anaerotruncus sp.]|nr:hypothetical protein [Anaerotruncus sp.]